MATLNPHYDAEAEENRLDQLEQEREMRHKDLLQDPDFITNTLTEDEVPELVIDTVAAQIGRITITQAHDEAYRVIGRAIVEWIVEEAWKVSKKNEH